ncbi:hypothetical protein ACFFK7_07905 [Pseudoalteromonas xiamenensis]|uniref:hypothetical protein n=1 Tax=Pseudoalteromonas xiamenensis TaxID=882626 RepID=UPI0035E64C4D
MMVIKQGHLWIGFVVALCLLDFFTRVQLSSTSSSNNNEPSQLQVTPLSLPQALASEELMLSFEQFKQNTGVQESAANESMLSTSDETKLIANNQQFELKAVIKDTRSYAILLVTDLKSNTSKLHKVSEGETLFGYEIEFVAATRINLVNAAGSYLLMMYQPNNKEKA